MKKIKLKDKPATHTQSTCAQSHTGSLQREECKDHARELRAALQAFLAEDEQKWWGRHSISMQMLVHRPIGSYSNIITHDMLGDRSGWSQRDELRKRAIMVVWRDGSAVKYTY